MSAIVAALNGHAAAIAADSAVTIGGKKVFNCANKIFALSKYEPVAIAIYNNTSLLDIPWEIIIKEYRKQLGNKKMPHLKDYAEDFFSFLKTKDFYSNSNKQRGVLYQYFGIYLDALAKEVGKSTSDFESEFTDRINSIVKDYHTQLECFKSISKDSFFNDNQIGISEALNIFNKKYKCSIDIDAVTNVLYSAFICAQMTSYVTGLVFVGYGDDELFPSLINFETGFIINGLLSINHISNKDAIIDSGTNAAVCPFAQTDVMDTILRGVAPKIMSIFENNYSKPIERVFGDMAKLVESSHPTLANSIRDFINNNLPNYKKLYFKECQDLVNKEYIFPFINSVIALDKEDLADFVESLIKLTSIKRKISPDQPTVGGPIDVMVISKGDGIIWMKRKHYFKPELNNHFFQNYFR